jgi:hypothetical protein
MALRKIVEASKLDVCLDSQGLTFLLSGLSHLASGRRAILLCELGEDTLDSLGIRNLLEAFQDDR